MSVINNNILKKLKQWRGCILAYPCMAFVLLYFDCSRPLCDWEVYLFFFVLGLAFFGSELYYYDFKKEYKKNKILSK